MRFEFKPSFDRSVKSFHGREKEEIKKASLQAIDILSQDRILPKGIGLKRLKGDFWEKRKFSLSYSDLKIGVEKIKIYVIIKISRAISSIGRAGHL